LSLRCPRFRPSKLQAGCQASPWPLPNCMSPREPARYRTPVQSIGRWKVTACQVPVFLRGATTSHVQVNPGDFILGDEDGAIVIPSAMVEQVLVEAERLTVIERDIRSDLKKGLTLADALNKYGHV
jgi:4-hydroxy-4-methyl-2-oxoglutarate aldolase